MSDATDVLLSGCSAGGLAALLAADTIYDLLVAAGAPLRRFKLALFSGNLSSARRLAICAPDAHDLRACQHERPRCVHPLLCALRG